MGILAYSVYSLFWEIQDLYHQPNIMYTLLQLQQTAPNPGGKMFRGHQDPSAFCFQYYLEVHG